VSPQDATVGTYVYVKGKTERIWEIIEPINRPGIRRLRFAHGRRLGFFQLDEQVSLTKNLSPAPPLLVLAFAVDHEE